MHPTLQIGPLALSSYTVLLDLGLLGGGTLAYLKARRQRLNVMQVLDAILATALGGLLTARIVYVASHWAYYQDYVRRALRPWDGGLAWQGALVGGLTAVAIFCAIQRISLLVTLDVLTPGAALLAIFAWLGCLLSGCAPGVETYPGQGLLWSLSLDLPDLYGIWAPRVAVQLLGAIWSTVALGLVILAERREQQAGLAFSLWLTAYSIGSFMLGFVRGDEAPLVGSWRVGQVTDLALTVSGAVLSFALALKKRQRKEAHR